MLMFLIQLLITWNWWSMLLYYSRYYIHYELDFSCKTRIAVDFTGQYLILSQSESCFPLQNLRSGMWIRIPNVWITLLHAWYTFSLCIWCLTSLSFEVMMHFTELLELMPSAYLWRSLVHKKAHYWTACPRYLISFLHNFCVFFLFCFFSACVSSGLG